MHATLTYTVRAIMIQSCRALYTQEIVKDIYFSGKSPAKNISIHIVSEIEAPQN